MPRAAWLLMCLTAPCRYVPVNADVMLFQFRNAYPLPVWARYVIPGALVAALAISDIFQLFELDAKAPLIETRGTVVRLECENHGNYVVSFESAGRRVERFARSTYLRRSCGTSPIGATVSVWYSGKDAEYVSFVSPTQAREIIKQEVLTSLVVGYPFLVGFLFLMSKFASHDEKHPE